MIKILLASVLLFHTTLSATQADKKCEEALAGWWSKSGITWNLLDFFEDGAKKCWASEENFVACWKALQSLAHSMNLRVQVANFDPLPVGYIQIGPFVVRPTIAEFRGAMPVSTLLAHRSENLRELAYTYSSLKNNASASRASFTQLINFLKDTLRDLNDPPMAIGKAYEAFQRVTDLSFAITSKEAAEEMLRHEGVEKASSGMWAIALEKAKILFVEKGGAAEKAGVQNGDQLLEIDGVDVRAATPLEVARLAELRAEGTPMRIMVNRSGTIIELSFQSELTSPFESRMLETPEGRYGYLLLRRMSVRRECRDMAEAVRSLEAQGAKGIILDLRQNTGGSVQFAACIGGIFLGEKAVAGFVPKLYLQRRKFIGGKVIALQRFFHYKTELPLAVLIDEYTVSAGELLAGSFQDYRRGWLIGRTTMGKGEYSTIFQDKYRQFATQETVAEYLLPSHRSIHMTGVSPDFLIRKGRPPLRWRDGYLFPKASPFAKEHWENPRKEYIEWIKDHIAQNLTSWHDDEDLEYALQVLRAEEELELPRTVAPLRLANFANTWLKWRLNRRFDKQDW